MQTSGEVKALDTELAEIDKLTEFTTTLPNIPADSVPKLELMRMTTLRRPVVRNTARIWFEPRKLGI